MTIERGQVWTAKGYGSEVTVTKAGEKTVTFVNREGTSQRLSVTGFRQLFVPKETKAEEAPPVKAEALPLIEVTITPSTQYATVYCDGKAVGTVQRRRVYDKTSPVWTAYNLKGEELFTTNFGARAIVRGFAEILLPPPEVVEEAAGSQDIPVLERHCGSWVVVDRATGKAVLETFERKIAESVNQERYEVVTALQWLCRCSSQA